MNSDLLNDEDIVISGIGFKLPGAENLSDLTEKLFGKKTLIAEGSQNHGEEIKDLKNFDFTFFGISNVVARDMDPMTRKILERTFEAVIDAGLNPSDIKGTNASVFSGSSFSDYDLVYLMATKGKYAIIGRDRCMNANRVSYWLDLKGYSVSYDAYYANGIQNIVSGWDAIRKGFCDTAIVSAANFQSAPEAAEQLNDFKKLSPEGKSKSYDDSADGWSRSDGVAVFVLQRANIAKRCYAVIEHALSKIYGDTPDILQKPSQHYWELMLNEFYAQSKLKPNDISYVEGDGTGIKEDDAEELNALTSVFGNNRTSPLLLGSIKSNIGHAEGASGSCAILKAIISMEQGVIPKNKHYKSPNSLSPGLINGKVKVVDKNVPLPSNGLIAINVFSMPSIYGHMILRANPKVKKNINCDQIPRLVPISVRQDEFFDDVLDKIEAEPYDPEQINLLQGIFSKSVDRYLSRGYTILPKMNDVSIREHQVYDPVKRPLWFIFSGMGSQWTQMGKRLMDLPLFRTSIEKSHEVLKKKGLNLVEIITTDDPKIFDNILHSFVGIAAIQIALVDLLSALDIVPDNIIGHSVGELGCSYADGCLTAEQTILCAYSRGKASVESSLIKGFMAAIGKGYNQIKDEIPDGIEVACHNAADSCTISGPAELVQNYVKVLQDRKIFARTVNVSNIAYHSQYIKPAAPKLLEYLKEVIPEPKLRSEKWISTSNLEENWNTDLAKYCSAEYHTNNLLSSVYFEEGSRKIPENAICIEIAPHGLLQAILKRSLGKTCINIPLTNRTAKDELTFFLQAVGKMYMVGLNPKIQELYPKIEYPVSRGTGSLHQFIRWEHDHVFPSFRMISRKQAIFSLKERLSKTSVDGIAYVIDENNYYPFSIFIVLIWEIFASSLDKDLDECPVIFENVKVEKLIPVHETEADEVYVHIGIGTGQFAISTDRIVVSGTISLAYDLKMKIPEDTLENHVVLKTETDLYDQFYRKSTVVGKYLKNINLLEITENARIGKISISSDWMQTLESMIQLKISENESESLSIPMSVRKLIISPETHKMYKKSIQNSNDMAAEIIKFQNVIKCGGIEMKGLQLRPWSKVSSELKLESTQFVPFVNPPLKNLWRFVDYCFGIVVNNSPGLEINILETGNRVHDLSVASYLQDYFSHTNIKFEVLQGEKTKNARFKYDLVISSVLKEASPLINENGFIFAKFPAKRTQIMPTDLEIISKYSLNQDEFILFKKKELSSSFDVITIPNDESMLCQIIKGLEDKSKNTTYLIGYYKDKTVKEIIKKHLWKDFVPQLRWIFIYDNGVTFDVSNPVFADQLQKGLAANIYFNGSWGTFYQRQFREKKIQVDSIFTKFDDELTIAYFGTDEEENFNDMNKFQVEYSGKMRGKTHVMGIASVENKKWMADDVLQWNIPPNWTLEDGATVPLTYSLMYFYLKIIAKLLPFENKSVLITDGLSYNGQAAISVAQALRLKIYVTVNEEKEISQLRGLYPFIEEKDVLTHDDDNFDVSLNLITENSNPHVVINNLEEDKLLSAINSVPKFSRIFHFGKKDIRQNNEIGMHFFLHNVSFFGSSSAAISGMSVSEKEEIRDFVKSAIEKGLIKPLPRVVCSSGTFKNEIVSDNRLKKLFLCDTKCELNRFSIHPEKSYLIIDDESNTGLIVSEWLIHQNVRNIIISSQNPSFSEKILWNLQEQLQRQLNIIVVKDSCETELLKTAKRLGPLAAVFYVNMEEGSKSIVEIDKLYRNSQSILVAISKDDSLTELCAKRTKEGYTSTNFIWKAGKKLSYSDLNFMLKLCGEDFVFLASDGRNVIDEAEKTRRILSDTLPNSIETFCDLGSSLSEEVRLIELPNSGLKSSETKETSPIFILSGLQDDPKNIALPLSRKLMYPVYLVRLPNKANEFSVEKLGSAILSKIQIANKYEKCYNILGISWGSYVAVEVSRLLEKSGARVSLMLVDVPKRSKNMRTSLEKNLIEIVRGASREMSRDVSHLGSPSINSAISNLNLPEEKTKKHMKDAVNYIYNCLRAVFNYDYSDIKLKGPVTIMNTSGMELNSSIQKICKDASVKNLLVNHDDVLTCKETVNIINGCAIAISMSDHSIYNSGYEDLEKFLEEERLNDISNQIFITGTQRNISW